jgi:DnaJ-class molecular chaperone
LPYEECKFCKGTGKLNGEKCWLCHGTGVAKRSYFDDKIKAKQ